GEHSGVPRRTNRTGPRSPRCCALTSHDHARRRVGCHTRRACSRLATYAMLGHPNKTCSPGGLMRAHQRPLGRVVPGAVIALALALAACGGDDDAAADTPAPVETPAPSAEPTVQPTEQPTEEPTAAPGVAEPSEPPD